MDKIFTLIGAALMLYAAYLLWQKAQRQPVIAYQPDDTHTRSGYIPPTPLQQVINPVTTPPPGEAGWGQTHTISPETLAAWAAADAAENLTRDDSCTGGGRVGETLPDIIKPSWATNLYESLGVERDATPEQIRTAYREQCNVWHPDKNSDPEAANEFAIITQAYRTLTTQREQYDAGLAIEEETFA